MKLNKKKSNLVQIHKTHFTNIWGNTDIEDNHPKIQHVAYIFAFPHFPSKQTDQNRKKKKRKHKLKVHETCNKN